ncbi:MAG TPA: cytochrome b/b6 domain-containing protein [Tepidisphaeraceae bacterium]|nr:cytochrome b/b6 domain-containing protein [Tepidisphaeraceae bacterium]
MKRALHILIAICLAALAAPAWAADTEGCLACHQYRGLSRISSDGKSIEVFYVDPNYYSMSLGPHAVLKCTDCHERSQVEVFPHLPVSPVDCQRLCHITGPNQVEVRFSHDQVAGMLEHSVHNQKNLAIANDLLGKPLKDGESRCLLCHDEPSFRHDGQSMAAADAPIQRCDTCHDEQLPINTRQFYWHVVARAEPARNKLDIVRTCAMCHSNPAIRARFNLPDVTASYLFSFHGKAVLLGSEETAGCLDCHAGQTLNVHEIIAPTDPASPTNPANLPDTCRAPACHRDAGARLTSAAVHLELSGGWDVEFFIACLFILLILFTFIPSLLMTALKMLDVVIGRRDPEEHARQQKVQRMLEDPKTRAQLTRFTVHQRLQHWLLATCFITLVLTGFPMKFADHEWARWLIGEFGGLSWARTIHHFAGAVLILGLLYHLIYIARGIRKECKTSGKSWVRALTGLPMFVGPADVKQMNGLMLYLVGIAKNRPAGGRFNAEEKFEYIGVFWGSIVLGITGSLMWFNTWTSQHLPGRILTIAIIIHTMEAFLALLHVGIVHMVSVIFSPRVFPLSKAMFTGETPASEMAEGHSEMLPRPEAPNA